MDVTHTLVKYIIETTYNDFPEEVVNKVKRLVLDSLGCALGGSLTEIGKIVIDLVKYFGGNPQSTVVACKEKTSSALAAFANSRLANALDFDDTPHIGATTIPSAIAVGEEVNASGKDLITAIVLGYEVSMRISSATSPSEARRFRSLKVGNVGHGTAQTFSSVVTTGKLLDLDEIQMLNALGIAGCCAPLPSVMKATYNPYPNKPNMVKNNYGFASEVGVIAGHLAKRGFTGPHNVLDGETGFWRMRGSDRCDYDMMTRELGKKYEIMNVAFKPYSACRGIHASIDSVLNTIQKYEISINEIDRIVIIPRPTYPFTNYEPKTMVEAQYSTPYSVATVISGIIPGPDCFTPEMLKNPKILKLARKIELKGERMFPGAKCEIYVKEKKYSSSVEFPKGDPNNPMTNDELDKKFRYLSLKVLEEKKVTEIMKLVGELDKIYEIDRLTNLLKMY